MKPTPAAIMATAALVLLAACSASPTSAGPGGGPSATGSSDPQLLAFSHCMRANRIPDYPDPEPGASNTKVPDAQYLKVSDSVYQTAMTACQHLLPPGTNAPFPAAELPALLAGMRRFSQCMRSHGQPNWPDPTVSSAGQPGFDLSAHGISRSESRSPQMAAIQHQCGHLLPSALGGIPVG